MKKTALNFTAVLLFAAGLFACGEKEPEDKGESVPVEFTEYSLAGTECQWTNLSYDANKVIIINSKKDLEKYITCEGGDFINVDFSKNTLLVACGGVAGGVSTVIAELTKTGTEYVLKVDVLLDFTAIAGDRWKIALLTDKLTVNYIKLNVLSHR